MTTSTWWSWSRCFICSMVLPCVAIAQDISMNIEQADSLFLSRNLLLMAAEMEIESAKALEIQARAYPNPNFEVSGNLRDPENDRWAHWGPTGQKTIGFEQLILLGGKRKHEIQLAKQDLRQAELVFEELLRNLRFRMRSDFYRLYFLRHRLEIFQNHLDQLKPIRDHFDAQIEKGNIALREGLRLESVYLDMFRRKSEIQIEIEELDRQLGVLFHEPLSILPVLDDTDWAKIHYLPPLDSLISLAERNRPDIEVLRLAVDQSETQLKREKAQAIPDLSLVADYDHMGGAFGREWNFGVSIPLPLWDRNRGRIKHREWEARKAEALREAGVHALHKEVQHAWTRMKESLAAYEKTKTIFDDRYDQVLEGLQQSLLKRHISLLEFIDFFESYQEAMLHLDQFRLELMHAREALHYVINKII